MGNSIKSKFTPFPAILGAFLKWVGGRKSNQDGCSTVKMQNYDNDGIIKRTGV
jgi:hypothetical protein